MPLSFRYPVPGSTGAVAGGDLVTACGTYSPPGGGATTSIWGMVYPPSGPFDATPPSGASTGSCSPSSATWHFNGCWPPLGGGMTIGSSYVLRVWQRDSNSSNYQYNDCQFTACLSGSGTCVPDCPAPAPQPGPTIAFGCESIVIRDVAARKFRVLPAAGVAALIEAIGPPGLDEDDFSVVVAYDPANSTHDRAIWVSDPQNNQQFRLEVRRGGCCNEAILTRIRLRPASVETLNRWEAPCFDIVHGGEFCSLTSACALQDGGVHLQPVGNVLPAVAPTSPHPAPPEGRVRAPQEELVPMPPDSPAPAPRARARRPRRGRA